MAFAETLALDGIAASIGSIGDVPPDEFEATYYADITTPTPPVLAPA